MKKIALLSITILLLLCPRLSYATCTSQDLVSLKAAGYTPADIDSICPICSSEDIIIYAQAGKTRSDIITLCSVRTKIEESPVPMKWYQLLITKPIVIGFDAYHTSKVIKNENNDGKFNIDKNGGDIFNLYIKYILPVSSIVYAFNEDRPDKPNQLLKAFKFYVEGNMTNGIYSNDESSGLTIKTKTESFYSVGVKFETDIETLFSTGKTYKSSTNY
jgi:hypothetical protein